MPRRELQRGIARTQLRHLTTPAYWQGGFYGHQGIKRIRVTERQLEERRTAFAKSLGDDQGEDVDDVPQDTGRSNDARTPTTEDGNYFVGATLVFDHHAAAVWVPELPESFEEAPQHFYGDGAYNVGGFFPGYKLIAARDRDAFRVWGEDFCSAVFHWHGMFFFYDSFKDRVLPLGSNQTRAIDTMWDLEDDILHDHRPGWVGMEQIEKYGASHFFDKDRPILTPDSRFKAVIDAEAAAKWWPHLPESFQIPPNAFRGDTPGLVELFFNGYTLIAARGPGECIGALFQWRGAFFYWDSIEDRALPLSANSRRAREILRDLEEDRALTDETHWLTWGALDDHAAAKLFQKTVDGYYLRWPLRK
jgi:hypothetical protein